MCECVKGGRCVPWTSGQPHVTTSPLCCLFNWDWPHRVTPGNPNWPLLFHCSHSSECTQTRVLIDQDDNCFDLQFLLYFWLQFTEKRKRKWKVNVRRIVNRVSPQMVSLFAQWLLFRIWPLLKVGQICVSLCSRVTYEVKAIGWF